MGWDWGWGGVLGLGLGLGLVRAERTVCCGSEGHEARQCFVQPAALREQL